MATAINTLYPPVVPTFSPTFIYKEPLRVYYSLSQYNSPSRIARLHITVVNQLNNENALKDTSGVLFSEFVDDKNHYDRERGMYFFDIDPSQIKGDQFNINQFYKIQIRFDSCGKGGGNITVNTTSDDESKQGTLYTIAQIDSQPSLKNQYLMNKTPYFSEWSSVTLVRPIQYPHIMLKNFSNGEKQGYNKGIVPLNGGLFFTEEKDDQKNISQVETETLQSYKVEILDETRQNVIMSKPTVFTGENIDPNDIQDNIDIQTTSVQEGDNLWLRVTATTRNQYEFHQDFEFQVLNFENIEGFDPDISVSMDNENGILYLTISVPQNIISGTFYVKRLSSLDNFSTAQEIYSAYLHGSFSGKDALVIQDNTVQSLVWYRYSVQYKSSGGVLAPIEYSEVVMPDFYDATLSRGDQQYSIRYGYTVSNIKPNVNRSKVDTLGGKYPRFVENAVLHYKQFSISGLISAEADMYKYFLNEDHEYTGRTRNYRSLYKQHPTESILANITTSDEYDPEAIRDLVRNDVYDYKKFADMGDEKDGSWHFTDSTSTQAHLTRQNYMTTTQNDWMWEREFREQLVEWLNDGEPKLYRSKQEGNVVVMLTDISLSPQANHSRFLYQFSATMYEVADANSLDTLDSLGIYDVQRVSDTVSSGKSDDDDNPNDYVTVVKPGQSYEFITSKVPIGNLVDRLLNDLKIRYGYTGQGIDDAGDAMDVYDQNSVLANKKPDDLYIKNVRLYFQSQPHIYSYDANGMLYCANLPVNVGPGERYPENGSNGQDFSYIDSSGNLHQYKLGYVFNMITKKDGMPQQVFVNERGYYQIPNTFDVYSLTFPQDGDKVTLDYTVVYKESNNYAHEITGSQVDRTIIGQRDGIFNPDVYQGDFIKQKYSFISDTNSETGKGYQEVLKTWKGISLDVTPFAICRIKYYKENDPNEYMVGETGVLNIMSNTNVDDICFVGRRMTIVPKAREKFMREWQCVIDDSGKNYPTLASIKHPVSNKVYTISGSLKIYYRNGDWYNFIKNEDGTGLAKVPIEGQINYWGSVQKSTF